MEIMIPLPKGAHHQTPDRIVIHAMGEWIGPQSPKHAVEFLRSINLSAHMLITPSGDIIRCRKPTQGAWHAGNYNPDSIGMEILVPGVHDLSSFYDAIDVPGWCPEKAWDATVEEVKRLMGTYDIKYIDRHSDLDPSRKRDPGAGFPWDRFLSEVNFSA